MMNVKTRKKILAKLMAEENIRVVYGNYPTGSFDLTTRILRIPNWEDVEPEIFDWMVGHEVSHALNTPIAKWTEFIEEHGPRFKDYLNVVEDIRIEKLIIREYPGLSRAFFIGYREMQRRDFFGISGCDISTLSLTNRINIKAKLRSLIDVPFSSEEQHLVDMAFAVETWDDVVAATIELVNDTKKKTVSGNMFTPSQESDDFEMDDMDFAEPETDSFKYGLDSFEDFDSSTVEGDENSDGMVEGNEDFDGTVEGDENSDGTVEGDEDFIPPPLETVEVFEESLSDVANKVKGNLDSVSTILYPSFEVLLKKSYVDPVTTASLYSKNKYDSYATDNLYHRFVREMKPMVNLMVKEFNQRKSTEMNRRTATRKKGILDPIKLHSYRYNEDIFLSRQIVNEGDSYGMLMMIDGSTSMEVGDGGNTKLALALRQSLIMAEFCERIRVPYEVVIFTSTLTQNNYFVDDVEEKSYPQTKITSILSSELPKKDALKMKKVMFYRTTNRPKSYGTFFDIHTLGMTPLADSYMMVNALIDRFKKNNKVAKMVFLSLTDGLGNVTHTHKADRAVYSFGNDDKIRIDSREVDADENPVVPNKSVESAMVKNLKKRGVTPIHFYVTGRTGELKVKRDVMGFDKSFMVSSEILNFSGDDEITENSFDAVLQKRNLNKIMSRELIEAIT